RGTRKLRTNHSGINEEHTLRGWGRGDRTYVILILEEYINNLGGTDGLRVLCHQFYTSSNYPLQYSPASSRSSFQRSRYLLSLRHSAGLGRKAFPTAYQLRSARLCWREWRTMNPTAR